MYSYFIPYQLYYPDPLFYYSLVLPAHPRKREKVHPFNYGVQTRGNKSALR